MFMTDEFVLSINSCWNAVSNNLFLCGVRVNAVLSILIVEMIVVILQC